MGDDRGWMYRRRVDGTRVNTPEFLKGLDGFIEVATRQTEARDGDKIRCPCRKFDNLCYKDSDEVRQDLMHNGFILHYQTWRFHGERVIQRPIMNMNMDTEEQTSRTYHTMVIDHAGPYYNTEAPPSIEEPPNAEAQKIYDLLNAADRKVWSGSEHHSQLSCVVRLMSMKAGNHISEGCYNQITTFIKELLPKENLVPDNYYSTKKLLRGIGLPVEKIDCCPMNCMLIGMLTVNWIAVSFATHHATRRVIGLLEVVERNRY